MAVDQYDGRIERRRPQPPFASPQYHVGKIAVGTEFPIREGKRTVARGRVTKILHLEENAARMSAN